MSTSKKPSTLKTLRKSLANSLRRLSKTPPAWKTLGRSLSRGHKGNLRKAASARHGWQETLRRGTAVLRPAPKGGASPARRRAARVTLGQRAGKGAAGLRAFSRQRFAGLLAVPKEKLWRRTALLLGAVAVLSVAGNLLMYFRFTPARPLVTIGHRVIRNREYLAQLDGAAGRPVLTRLVFTELIHQAAAKAGVTPTGAQIDARLAEMKRRGQAPANGPSPEYRDGLALDLALENLRVRDVTASDAEAAAFYKKYAAQFTQPAQVESILVLTRSDYAAQTAAGLLAKGKSAPAIAAQPDMRVDGQDGFHLDLSPLPPAMHQSVVKTALAMRPGQITTLPLGNAFLTIKCLHSLPGNLPPLAQVRDLVTRLVKLQKAPSANAEMALLYKANKPDFDIDRYAAYFAGVDRADTPAPPPAPKTASVP